MPPVIKPTPAPADKNKKKKAEVKSPAPAPAAVVEPTTVEQPSGEIRELIYDRVSVEEYSKNTAPDLGPITEEWAKIALGWETETDFAARMRSENPGIKDGDPFKQADGTVITFGKACTFGDNYLLTDEEGNKVRCWNNLDNREFDERHCRGLAQTILKGDWAGPTTMPGETVNGSTIVISRTGKIESGQHSLVSVVLACQMWRKNRSAYPFWETVTRPDPSFGEIVTGPVIETIVVTGISEAARVIMTVDNCKQRTPTDVFYTSELFRHAPPAARKEYSRMMAVAVDMLWKRTDARGYKTLPEVVNFQERHKKLLKAVEHLFQQNSDKSGRKITNKIMSAGQAAAICYLMGCSGPGTDGDVYRNMFPPTERDLDWSLWDKAKQFWSLVASHDSFAIVREAINRLTLTSVDGEDATLGLGGTSQEKLAILSKAWDVYLAYDPASGAPMFTPADLAEGGALWLRYTNLDANGNKLADGQLTFLDTPDFRGIDVPADIKIRQASAAPDSETPIDIEKEKEAVRRAAAAETKNKIKAIALGSKK